MAETELPWVFTGPLERAEIPYMIVGAFATLAFGAVRTTEDLDLVLGLVLGDLGVSRAPSPRRISTGHRARRS